MSRLLKRWIGLALTLALTLALLCGGSAFASGTGDSYYQLGDRMEDFAVTLADGTQTSLYGLLAEKKAVLINLWASWCGPCRREFPAMEQAYNEMSDEIGVIALSIEPTDTDEVILAFQEEMGLTTLPMGRDQSDVAKRFDFVGIPTSVMVDRSGVVCFQDSSTIPDKDKFLRLFSLFTAQDYAEPVLVSEIPPATPTVERPTVEALSAALGIQDDEMRVELPSDPLLWPFLPAEDGTFAWASNASAKETTALVTVRLTAGKGDALAYDYAASLSPVQDVMSVTVDGTVVNAHSVNTDWTTDFVIFDAEGEHEVAFAFHRSLQSAEKAEMKLRGLRLVGAEEAAARKDAPPKTLPGTNCELEATEGQLKEAQITQSFSEEKMKIQVLEGEQMTLRIQIGAEVNDKLAYLYDDGGCRMLSTLESDGEGYLYRYQAGERPATNSRVRGLYLFPSALEQGAAPAASIEWFDTEADVDAYLAVYQAYLEANGMTDATLSWAYADGSPKAGAREAERAALPEGMGEYVIAVTDEQGQPVPGAMVQICDEGTCQVAVTDADGLVTHIGALYPYEIHLLKAPDGYAGDAQTYVLPKEGGSVTITLQKS